MICCFFPRFLNVNVYDKWLALVDCDFLRVFWVFKNGSDMISVYGVFDMSSVWHGFSLGIISNPSVCRNLAYFWFSLTESPTYELALDPITNVLLWPGFLFGVMKVYSLDCFFLFSINSFLGTSVKNVSVLYFTYSFYRDFLIFSFVMVLVKSSIMLSWLTGAVLRYYSPAFLSLNLNSWGLSICGCYLFMLSGSIQLLAVFIDVLVWFIACSTDLLPKTFLYYDLIFFKRCSLFLIELFLLAVEGVGFYCMF